MGEAADIYAEQLLPKGYGFPLWLPEPDVKLGEVKIGDVGYLWGGSFCTLFNATLPASDPANKDGVPDGFVPLEYNSNRLVRRWDALLPDGPLFSQTVKRISIEAQAGTGAIAPVAGAQVDLAFECVRAKGGLLVLNGGGAIQEVLRPNKTFAEYIHRHHDSWVEFAKKRGHVVPRGDIIMVRGWVKASEWIVAAFKDESKYQLLQLAAQAGSIANAGLKFSVREASSTSVEHRTGASQAPAPSGAGATMSAFLRKRRRTGSRKYAAPKNQCVFLSRYKTCYRKWPWQMIRAAGSKDEEPPAGDGSGDGSMFLGADHESDFVVEDDSVRTRIFDPVDSLLRYILDNSDCEVAISSDEDLRELGIADYDRNAMSRLLELLKPRIEVSDSGVGTLSLTDLSRNKSLECIGEQDDTISLLDNDFPSEEWETMDIVRSRMFMSVPEGSCERTTVPQEAYRTQDPYTQLPKIQFCAREMPGIRLADALDLDSLISILDGASDKMALSGMSPTIFLRILWPGYDMWHASIRIVQPDHGLKPITRAKLALEVAKKVEACLHNLSTVPSQDRWSDWCATKYSIDQVMLLELNHVAAGSWQPMLAVSRTDERREASYSQPASTDKKDPITYTSQTVYRSGTTDGPDPANRTINV